MRLSLVFLLLAVLLAVFGCARNFDCRRDAYAKVSNVNAGPGLLGNLMVRAIDGPAKPHPPLADMLADCDRHAP